MLAFITNAPTFRARVEGVEVDFGRFAACAKEGGEAYVRDFSLHEFNVLTSKNRREDGATTITKVKVLRE